MNKKYKYTGVVKLFDETVATNWTGETYAGSEAKAKSNLAYRYKKSHNLSANAKISLPGEIKEA